MIIVFLVMTVILLVLIALIVAAATANRQANYQMGPGYVVQEPIIVDDTPLIAGMIAADVAADIAFSANQPMVDMNQGQYFDSQDSGFGGGDFLGGDQAFDSSSSGFDIGGGGDF